jgi:hypothetical protein
VFSFYFGNKIFFRSCKNFRNVMLFVDYIKFDPQTFYCYIFCFESFFFSISPLEIWLNLIFILILVLVFIIVICFFSYYFLIEFFYLLDLILILVIAIYFIWNNLWYYNYFLFHHLSNFLSIIFDLYYFDSYLFLF